MEDPNDFGSIMQKIFAFTPENIEVLNCNGISQLEDLPGNALPSEKFIRAGLIKDDIAKLETFRQWYRSVPPYAKVNVLDHCDGDILKAFALSRDEKTQSFELDRKEKTRTKSLLKFIRVSVVLVFLVVCSSLVAIGSLRRNARHNTEAMLDGLCASGSGFTQIQVNCKKLDCSCCFQERPKDERTGVVTDWGAELKKCSDI
jgi:hypothetical protein